MTEDDDLPRPAALLREDAVRMLMRSSIVAEMDEHDARLVINAMQPVRVAAGTVLMREGQRDDNDYLGLVLEGQVRAESAALLPGEEVVISIIGPGQLIGEMGLLDGAPRSATCTALTDVKMATLSRMALQGLVEVNPGIAARLLLGLAQAMADRVRATNRRLRTLSQVARALQRELDATHSVNRRLLERDGGPDTGRH